MTPAIAGPAPAEFCVYTVDKFCYRCNAHWTGASFVQHPAGASRLPGICASCLDEDEARQRALLKPHSPLQLTQVELDVSPPRRTADR